MKLGICYPRKKERKSPEAVARGLQVLFPTRAGVVLFCYHTLSFDLFDLLTIFLGHGPGHGNSQKSIYRPSIKGTKLLFIVIKAIIIIHERVALLTRMRSVLLEFPGRVGGVAAFRSVFY